MNGYTINEHFWTIQGEGVQAGRTALFIRLQGCPVGCPWCDSKLTWYNGGRRLTLPTLLSELAAYPPAACVVVTGGEPLLYDLNPLLDALRRTYPEALLTIETSGAYPFRGALRPDWLTVSPKHAANWRVVPNVLAVASELKYVVDETFTPPVAITHLAQIAAFTPNQTTLMPPVVLMPEGAPPRPEMVARTLDILRDHPHWRFGPRLQYNYSTINALEGRNNAIVTPERARDVARERVHAS